MTPLELAQKDSMKDQLDNLPFVMTPKKARKIIDVGHNKIYQLLNSGQLKAKRLHGKWLINKYDLMEFVLSDDSEDDLCNESKI